MKKIATKPSSNYAVTLVCHSALKIIQLLLEAIDDGRIIDESVIDPIEFTEKLEKLVLACIRQDATSIEAIEDFMADILGLYAVDFILPEASEEFQMALLKNVHLCMEVCSIARDNDALKIVFIS